MSEAMKQRNKIFKKDDEGDANNIITSTLRDLPSHGPASVATIHICKREINKVQQNSLSKRVVLHIIVFSFTYTGY